MRTQRYHKKNLQIILKPPHSIILRCRVVASLGSTSKERNSQLVLENISIARLAQSAERKALNLVVVGSSPTVGFHI